MSESEPTILLYSEPSCVRGPTDEVASESLRRSHFRLLGEVVEEAAGSLRILGDGCLAVVTDPYAAFGCAAALRTAVDRYNRRAEARLAVRTALHAGGPIRSEEDYLGASVGAVRRLCAAAADGTVLASADARELLDDPPAGVAFLAPTGSATTPVPFDAMEVVAAGPAVAIPDELVVGGDLLDRPELEELLRAWGEAGAGPSRAVLVSGTSGIGKTSLIGGLAERVHGEGGLVLYGLGGRGSGPFAPIAAALRPYLEACPDRLRREHGRAAGTALPWLMSEEGGPSGGPEGAVSGLLGLVADVAIDAPLLLVLDDLHVVDPSTLAVLSGLARGRAEAAVLALGVYVPDRVDRMTALWSALADGLGGVAGRVPLAPLPPRVVEGRVRDRLGAETPEAVVEAVREAADGNPFLLEQTLRHLAGVPAEARGDVRVPEGAAELLGHRFTALSDDADDLLREAAGLEARCFHASTLEGAGAGRVEPFLGELCEAGLLVGSGPGRYQFATDLVGEVARREAPTRAAGGPSGRPSAGRAAGIEPDPPAGSSFSIESPAEESDVSRDALLEVVCGFPDVFDLEGAEALLDRAPGREPLAEVIRAMADLARGALDAAARAAEGCTAGSDPSVSVFGRTVAGWCRWAEGQTVEGLDEVERAWATADGLDDAVGASVAVRTAAGLHVHVLDLRSARAVLMREVSKRRGPRDTSGRLLAEALSAVDALGGRRDEARRLAAKTGIDPELSVARPLFAFCDGRWDDVEGLWRWARDRAALAGATLPWGSDALLARVLRLRGRLEEASDLLEETLASVVGARIVPGELWVRAELTLSGAEAGDLDGAMEHLRRCQEIVGEGGEYAGVGARVLLARAVFEGKTAGTVSARKFEQAVDAFRRYGLPWDEVEALALWARACIGAGHPDGAERTQEATDALEECGAGPGWRSVVEVLVD